MKATLKNYRQAPRKMRLLADLVRGKEVEHALTVLEFTPKRGARIISKLISSAAANARTNDNASKPLVIKTIAVDEGFTLKRFRPRAFGRASRINKRTSHVSVELSEVTANNN